MFSKGYTKSCDWWSVGVIFYEMLVGVPPFRDDTALGTQKKVINWRQTLKIPDECHLTLESRDLIFKLCTDAETRLNADGIKAHAFFKNFDFGPNLRKSVSPYIPVIRHPTDTSNFEPIDHSMLADRQARIEQMHAHRLTQQQMQKQAPPQYNQVKNDYQFMPYSPSDQINREANQIALHSKSNYTTHEQTNNTSFNSSPLPNLYDFTFRRFFEGAYSSENLNRYYFFYKFGMISNQIKS